MPQCAIVATPLPVPSKLGEIEQFLVCDQSSSEGLCLQDYKSLHVAFMICANMVNTQTHRGTDSGYTISSAR